MKARIEEIGVGSRYRQDLGDVSSLAASISELGLLQPIVLTPGHELVAGQRRLEAVKSLGWSEVDVRIVESTADAVTALKAERDENTERKAMTPSEMVALGKRIEAIEKPKAEERLADGRVLGGKVGGRGSDSSRFPGPASYSDGLPTETGRVRHAVGQALGISGPTYQRLKTVVETAQDESQPDDVRLTAEQVLADIDAGKRGVRGGAEEVVAARDAVVSPEITTKRDQQRVAAHKRRLGDYIGTLAGRSKAAIEGIDMRLALADCSVEERKAFANQLDETLRIVKAIKKDLTGGI